MPDSEPSSSPALSRRSFLHYVGAGVSAFGAANVLGPLRHVAPTGAAPAAAGSRPWVRGDGSPDWTPIPYPVPLASDAGDAAGDVMRLKHFEVHDRLTLPDGFRFDVVAAWGDEFGPADDPARRVRVGYNCDYTGLFPVPGSPGEFWLVVNHEYISARPWLQGYARVYGAAPPVDAEGKLAGLLPLSGGVVDLQSEEAPDPNLAAAARALCRAAMGDMGVSVLRVRRRGDGGFDVVADATDHRRFAGASCVNAAAEEPVAFTGPAAGLLGKPAGTFQNCAGTTTPWGTFLSCEENYQDYVMEFVAPDGSPLPGRTKAFAGSTDEKAHPTKLPFEFEGLGQGTEPPLDGRHFGWVCEVDPAAGTLRKHTALGRFRHENLALRVEAGKRLAAYMGDDRRGGHLWKFVSKGVVADPADKSNAKLLEEGTLYVARLDADFTGRWLPVTPDAPLMAPEPEHTAGGHVWLPNRPWGGHLAVGIVKSKSTQISPRRWARETERRTGKRLGRWAYAGDGKRGEAQLNAGAEQMKLGDLLAGERPEAVMLTDAYVFGNAAGGTPLARPEDVEVHPFDRSVYVAFTDSTGSGDGSPDVRIFPDSRGENSQQYGAIYRLVEAGDDPAATEFTWGKFVAAGEAAEGGGGFACADNLAFDPEGNLWIVTDITTPAHNFPVTRTEEDQTLPGAKFFPGVFGNNALFMIPTAGPNAGVPHCFAVGPSESELTGPTFVPGDGDTPPVLILSVQHPGELNGTRGHPGVHQEPTERRRMKVAARDGTVFDQDRDVPLGSNFPSEKLGDVPRPCVVCIRRA